MTLVGRTALSLDTSTKRSTPASLATSASASVPNVLFCTPVNGFSLDERHVLIGGGVVDHLDAEVPMVRATSLRSSTEPSTGTILVSASGDSVRLLCNRRHLSSSISISIS